MTSIGDRRTQVLETAVELVGTRGVRALTHGRIDERSGLPKGSTSNYFRTRAALLAGVCDWIVEQELAELDPSFRPATVEELVVGLSRGIEALTGPARTRTAARLALFLEASHDAELRTAISRGRMMMEAILTAALARLGARDPDVAAAAVAACSEGIILHRVVRHVEIDPYPVIDLVVRAAVGYPGPLPRP
ncbi:DNA-binding transcriptional regulator YbjK [Raineyella antarctica]|uniref:DNA-binding transcriptional regulator YbjK n=1 Tax=Raineyella antarctica TaxID=1577474 RepID=A0A1G6GDG9_9ACTN|nr:TetR/AcrR family transcriptional regulator [Raineyella antarctica]SDB80020.1 DNA-binding transcriptional regulator YbjK [Raineyella antarctica]